MNNDDFEQQLARQELRPPPSTWRSPILQSATQACATSERPTPAVERAGWRSYPGWLWPNPVAWAGLAAVWLVALSLDWLAARPSGHPGNRAQAAQAVWAQWAQHREMIAELTETEWPKPAAGLPPRIFVPRPRSENASLHLRHA